MGVLRAIGLILLGSTTTYGFHHSVANPRSFEDGEEVELNVNKLTSSKTLMPLDNYRLPFCIPGTGVKRKGQNLGEFLAGDSIENSPYHLYMKKDMFCEQVCVTNLGREEQRGMNANKITQAIRKNYHSNWIVDNINAASKVQDDLFIITRFWGGFPIGFIDNEGKAYVHNHANIEIEYHPTETGGNRVVRFKVQPFSIKHDFVEVNLEDDDHMLRPAKINNAIDSCRKSSTTHTTYEMVTAPGRKPQPASGKVLFTYDVVWTRSETQWANRWDFYLSRDNVEPSSVHWVSTAQSLVIVFFLSAIIAPNLILRNGRNILASDEEETEAFEVLGEQLVHTDVFHPPCSSLALSVLCGTGAQLLAASFLSIIFAAFTSPERRGYVLTALLLIYFCLGSLAGYVTARCYKTFQGKSRLKATTLTAVGFPGACFATFVIMNFVAYANRSTYVVPSAVMLTLVVLWLPINTPLVFLGAYFGYSMNAFEFPVNTQPKIPVRPRIMTLARGGIPPFISCFVELNYILASVWQGQYYCTFWPLLLALVVLVLVCAETTVLLPNNFQLYNSDDRNWWWHSFCGTCSTGIYIFLYSIVYYFQQLEGVGVSTHFFYFGYMALACSGLSCMMGCVGMFSHLWYKTIVFDFNKTN